MRHVLVALIALLAAACGRDGDLSNGAAAGNSEAGVAGSAQRVRNDWLLRIDQAGAALTFIDGSGNPVVGFSCPPGTKTLLLNVAAFRPVASEERMTFGTGEHAVTLVAGGEGGVGRGGVTGEGGVPPNLAELLGGPVSVNHGSQNSGPHSAPAPGLAKRFAAACGRGGAPPVNAEQPVDSDGPAGACRIQDGRPIPANRLRAIGTEPFWGARVEGRCVTYSHPDDQSGTRVWTKFSGSAESGTWSGALGGSRFEMKTAPEPGCSDGMSGNRYPIAVTLTVGGEQRRGCAEPL